MKTKLRRSRFAQLVATALCGTYVIAAHAVPTLITDGIDTAATIDDAGYFSATSSLGLSFMGREFVNHGTFWSFYSLNANGLSAGVANEAEGSNPFGSTATANVDGSVLVTSSPGSDWSIIQKVSIPESGHVAVEIQLTNHTGVTATDVEWGVGLDPDQGIPVGLGFATRNVIDAVGENASITATSPDGWAITLANLTGGATSTIAANINCCDLDPHNMLTLGQLPGNYGFTDLLINLAYDLGTINNNQTVSFGYEYIMAISDPFIPSPIPEPSSYAMLLAGLGLLGFTAYRRKKDA